MKTKLTRSEQETVIRRAADEDSWQITTADPSVQRKLNKLGYLVDESPLGEPYKHYKCPKRCVSFRSLTPRKSTRNGFGPKSSTQEATSGELLA